MRTGAPHDKCYDPGRMSSPHVVFRKAENNGFAILGMDGSIEKREAHCQIVTACMPTPVVRPGPEPPVGADPRPARRARQKNGRVAGCPEWLPGPGAECGI